MIQQIITIIILVATVIIVLRKLVLTFSPKPKDCSSCACETANCQLLEIKKEIETRAQNKEKKL